MKIKAIVLFALVAANAGFAQVADEGPIKTFDLNVLMEKDYDQYKGLKFIYHNVNQYDGNMYKPPFPFSDGRERSGKFKASQTAMDNYLKSLSKYNGKTFSFVTVVPDEMNMPQLVLACENGDTLIFPSTSIANEFISKQYIDDQKKRVGSKFYINNATNIGNIVRQPKNPAKHLYAYFYGFKNEKTGKTIYYLPYLSEWKITAASYDTTYIGQRNMQNSMMNYSPSFDRMMFTIENPNYGKYKCFLNNGMDLIVNDIKDLEFLISTPSTHPEDVALINEWAAKNYTEAVFEKEMLNQKDSDKEVSPKIIELAKKGYLPALYEYVSKMDAYQDDNKWQKTKKELIEQTEYAKKAGKKYGKIKLVANLFNQIANTYQVVGRARVRDINERLDNYKKEMELFRLAAEYGDENAKEKYESTKQLLERDEQALTKIQQEEKARQDKIKAENEAKEAQKKAIYDQQMDAMKQAIKAQNTGSLKVMLEQYERQYKQFDALPADKKTRYEDDLKIYKAVIKLIKDELKTRKD